MRRTLQPALRVLLCMLLTGAALSGAFALQQKADYIITVTFDPQARTISGSERISYYNYSPDALKELYVHLYWNAFRPGSLMEAQLRNLGETAQADRIAGLTPEEQGGIDIDSVIINGQGAPHAVFGTIMRVPFAKPLVAGNAVDIIIKFTSHVPALVRRAGYMSADSVEFSMAQWYPKICAYDEKGWHADQYFGKEFYGEFGRFNVNIVAPREYCIAASGYCTNPMAAGCGYTIHVDTTIMFPTATDSNSRDFRNQLIDTLPTRRWQFEAANVHDFAWAADREFVHQILKGKITTIHAFFKRRYLSTWRDMAKEAIKAVEYLSDHYGAYPYDQVSVVQAGDGGMEYPQIIFLRGTPSLGTLVHELAHQWFYGILGNNESAEAWLDEGFTTFATTRAMREIYGEQRSPRTWLGGVLLPHNNPAQEQYKPYQRIAMSGHEEPVLQHSDAFRENDTYREVYNKTHAILNMLEYTVGDSVFARIIRAYCQKFRLTHPTSEGFMHVCRDVSGMDLQWFFDEWLRTTKQVDYAICGVSSEASVDSGFRTTLGLRRIGEAVMPVDVDLTLDDGAHQLVTVPCTWQSKDERGNITLPQWGVPMRSYSATFATPRPVTSAEIDPSLRLQDMNRLNNTTGLLPPMRVGVFTRFDGDPPTDAYGVSFVPRVWYSALEGAKAGLSVDAGYTFDRFLFHAGAYLNTKFMTADWWLNYRWRVDAATSVRFDAEQSYGIRGLTVIAERRFRRLTVSPTEHKLSLAYSYTNNTSDNYPWYTFLWNKGELNNARATYGLTITGDASLAIDASFESSLTKEQGYTRADVTALTKFPVSVFAVSLRVTAGTAGGNVPLQKRYYLAAADPDEQYRNSLYRGIAMVDLGVDTSAHMFLPGGGGMVGYVDQYAMHSGLSVASLTATCVYPIFNGNHALSAGVFGGWGYVSDNTLSTSVALGAPYFDGGAQVQYEFTGADAGLVQSLLLTHAPLSVQLALPFYVSRPASGEEQVKMRWSVGISAGL